MAVDEPQSTIEAKPGTKSWRSGEPVLVQKDARAKAAPTVWLKSLLDLFHRRAPA